MVSQTDDISTPREAGLIAAEALAAGRIRSAINPSGNARRQASEIWSIYRDYSQSEAARSVGIGDNADRRVRQAKDRLRVTVTTALLNLADWDRVLDSTRRDLEALIVSAYDKEAE